MDTDLTYRLTLQDRTGFERIALYKPHVSSLVWADNGYPVSLGFMQMDYEPPGRTKHVPVDPNERGKVKAQTLKIQLGLRCNFTCAYCNQASQVEGSIQGSPEDVEKILKMLPMVYDGGPNGDGTGTRIEFWGGEPFVYWKTLSILGSVIRSLYPKAGINIVTNGSMLTEEIIDWLDTMNISVGISHDGPAFKAQRDKADPLDDPEKLLLIRKLYERLKPKGHIGFNCVITRINPSIAAVGEYIAERLGVPVEALNLSTEEIILPYDEGGMASSPQNDDEQRGIMNFTFMDAVSGRALSSPTVKSKIEDFAASLASARPSASLGQKCGMDKPTHLAMNMAGEIVTCQNTSSTKKHRIGHASDLAGVKLHTLHHWMHRDECNNCPVLQLCKGACFYIEGDLWAKACENSFHYNVGMLASSLYYLTRLLLTKIEGPKIRFDGVTEFKAIELVVEAPK